ncbi:DUF5345 family protein [Bacillaceae bacterium Marseille-Q3522]|nr:DUF5345 family protein [Bacillaceae bacterium Marseille-Q3522]
MNEKEQEQLAGKVHDALQRLDDYEVDIPSITSLKTMVIETQRKQRSELFYFIFISLFVILLSVTLLIKIPFVYGTMQIVFVFIVVAMVMGKRRKRRVMPHE